MDEVQTMTFQKSAPGHFFGLTVDEMKPLKPKKRPGAFFRKTPVQFRRRSGILGRILYVPLFDMPTPCLTFLSCSVWLSPCSIWYVRDTVFYDTRNLLNYAFFCYHSLCAPAAMSFFAFLVLVKGCSFLTSLRGLYQHCDLYGGCILS